MDAKRDDSAFLKQKQVPMLVHKNYKILADMTKFIYYLYENFKAQMLVAKIWPTAKIEEIVYLMEWYSTKLRPFMWEFYGIMTAASEAGLTKENTTRENRDQNYNENISKLQQIHEEYLTRFKFMCTQIE